MAPFLGTLCLLLPRGRADAMWEPLGRLRKCSALLRFRTIGLLNPDHLVGPTGPFEVRRLPDNGWPDVRPEA